MQLSFPSLSYPRHKHSISAQNGSQTGKREQTAAKWDKKKKKMNALVDTNITLNREESITSNNKKKADENAVNVWIIHRKPHINMILFLKVGAHME